MSITIKANQLNSLIYKYLTQSGLTHSAYALLHEATLSEALQQFRYDIKAGHLVSLLEKGLIYAQIETHTSLSQYMECTEPFFLLQPHTCRVVEVVRKQKEDLMKELGEQINDSIRRTNAIYNTALPNPQIPDMVYDPRGNTYLDKFPKIRIPESQEKSLSLGGSAQKMLLSHIPQKQIDLLGFDDHTEEITVQGVVPMVSNGELQLAKWVGSSREYMVELFESGKVTVVGLGDEIKLSEFQLEGLIASTALFNPNLPHIITLCGIQQYAIVNLNTCSLLRRQAGKMIWKGYDQYLRIAGKNVTLCSLTTDPLLSIDSEVFWDSACFNNITNLFAVTNHPLRLIHVYTVESSTPLFIFDLQEDQSLLQVRWVESNGVDYLCWLTPIRLALYDLSLDSYAKVIDLRQLQSNPSQLLTLKKHNRDQNYLLCLGDKLILAYDVTNLRIERIQHNSSQATAQISSKVGFRWVLIEQASKQIVVFTSQSGSTWNHSSSDHNLVQRYLDIEY